MPCRSGPPRPTRPDVPPAPPTISISIVIVNWNSGGYLRANLDAIFAHMPSGNWNATVVDNCSTDGSERCALEHGPACRLIRSSRNAGFSAAVNHGVANTDGDFVLIMNPDCRIEAGAVEALAAVLEQEPDCAIAAPRVLDPDGGVQGSARGDPNLLTGIFGRSSRLTRLFPGCAAARRNVCATALASAGRVAHVDWVSGACMLARRSALTAIGGFDERYFLYWEDADVCRRVRSADLTVRYVPAARVRHAVGGSSRHARGAAVRAFHESAFLYYATHIAPGRWNPRRWLAWAVLKVRCAWQLGQLTPADGDTT